MNDRLISDCAEMMVRHLVERLNLAEEERSEAYREFFPICKAGIEAYEIQANRLQMRLKPLVN